MPYCLRHILDSQSGENEHLIDSNESNDPSTQMCIILEDIESHTKLVNH